MTTGSTKQGWKPISRLGWWAVGLMLFYVLAYAINAIGMGLRLNLPPVSGMLMLLVGFAASVCALIALIRKHERSWLVWFALLPGALGLFLVIGELLFPH